MLNFWGKIFKPWNNYYDFVLRKSFVWNLFFFSISVHSVIFEETTQVLRWKPTTISDIKNDSPFRIVPTLQETIVFSSFELGLTPEDSLASSLLGVWRPICQREKVSEITSWEWESDFIFKEFCSYSVTGYLLQNMKPNFLPQIRRSFATGWHWNVDNFTLSEAISAENVRRSRFDLGPVCFKGSRPLIRHCAIPVSRTLHVHVRIQGEFALLISANLPSDLFVHFHPVTNVKIHNSRTFCLLYKCDFWPLSRSFYFRIRVHLAVFISAKLRSIYWTFWKE